VVDWAVFRTQEDLEAAKYKIAPISWVLFGEFGELSFDKSYLAANDAQVKDNRTGGGNQPLTT
jgi:hypothetical protein